MILPILSLMLRTLALLITYPRPPQHALTAEYSQPLVHYCYLSN